MDENIARCRLVFGTSKISIVYSKDPYLFSVVICRFWSSIELMTHRFLHKSIVWLIKPTYLPHEKQNDFSETTFAQWVQHDKNFLLVRQLRLFASISILLSSSADFLKTSKKLSLSSFSYSRLYTYKGRWSYKSINLRITSF